MVLMDLMDLMVMVEKGGLAGVVEEVGGLEAQEVMADKANTEALHLEIPGCLEVRVTRIGSRNCLESGQELLKHLEMETEEFLNPAATQDRQEGE